MDYTDDDHLFEAAVGKTSNEMGGLLVLNFPEIFWTSNFLIEPLTTSWWFVMSNNIWTVDRKLYCLRVFRECPWWPQQKCTQKPDHVMPILHRSSVPVQGEFSVLASMPCCKVFFSLPDTSLLKEWHINEPKHPTQWAMYLLANAIYWADGAKLSRLCGWTPLAYSHNCCNFETSFEFYVQSWSLVRRQQTTDFVLCESVSLE